MTLLARHLQQQWQNLPIGTLDDVIGAGVPLVLSPHPDDESLGCGGLIAACCAASRPPVVVILTDGSRSHPGSAAYPPSRLATQRAVEVATATAILGLPAEHLFLLGEPDGGAPHQGPRFDAVVRRLLAIVAAFQCSAILTTWHGDPHCDHLAAAKIAGAVGRAAGLRTLAYPVWGWMLPADAAVSQETPRGWRLDVSRYLPVKRRAIAAHASQCGEIITDDPDGFRLPSELLRAMDTPWETFVQP